MKGDIEIKNRLGGVLGLGKKLILSKLIGEIVFKLIYKGIGEIFLELFFEYFVLIELEDDEIIINDGMFFVCEEGIEIDVIM